MYGTNRDGGNLDLNTERWKKRKEGREEERRRDKEQKEGKRRKMRIAEQAI